MARRKGRGHKEQTVQQRRRKNLTRDNVARRTSKGRTFGKRRRKKPETITGKRIHGLKKQLHLRSERTSGRIFGKTIGLEIVKRIPGTFIRLQKMSVRTFWAVCPLRNERRCY
jgi:hypothetical protein